jgi:hypothetical protein
MNLTLSVILGLALALGASLIGNYVQHNKAVAVAAVVEKDKAVAAAELTKAETNAVNAARAIERVKATKQAEIAEAFEKGKTDAKVTADRRVADLNAGTIRLRNGWASCETSRLSDTTSGSTEPDAATRWRHDSFGRILAGAEHDAAQIKALQAALIADREQ